MTTEKKIRTKTEETQNWYNNEIEKDHIELEREKQIFINTIKSFKKDDILPKKSKVEKLSLWKRILKTLTGS